MLMRGPLVIEWPERMQNVLPAEGLWITLEHIDDTERQFHFEARGTRAIELLERIRNTEHEARTK